MIDAILAIKFAHVVAAAMMLGVWAGVAGFMLLGCRTKNASVIALVAQFAVKLELFVVAPAIALQPLSGFPLAWAIGLSNTDDFWVGLAILIYAAVVALWIAAVRVEVRLRKAAREAALGGRPLAKAYTRLFRIWRWFAAAILAGMVALFLVMVWQPRLD